MTTPGTITAGELRKEHMSETQVLAASPYGRRIHRGWTVLFGWATLQCGSDSSANIIESPDHREIEYFRLCRKCFPDLTKGMRP